MDCLHVSASDPDESALQTAAAVLARGGLVVFPTDTFYGLAADPWQVDAVARIFAAKGRAASMALPLIAADRSQAERATTGFSALAARLADAFWPGPLTLVLQANPNLAEQVHAGSGSVAVRVPDHVVARRLAAAAGGLITATSANRSGSAASATADVPLATLREFVDLVLDAGPTPGGPASTIIDVRDTPIRLVRSGAVPFAKVLEVLSAP